MGQNKQTKNHSPLVLISRTGNPLYTNGRNNLISYHQQWYQKKKNPTLLKQFIFHKSML